MKMRSNPTPSKDEEGYILVMVAVLLVVMLALTGLAVDIGIQYAARTQSQAAADAAALAGAYTFTVIAPQPATAQNQAKQVAITNHTAQGTITTAQVTAVADVANRRIAVDIDTDQPTLFSKVLGFNSAHVHTRAVAEAAEHASASPCVKPWFIPNTLGTTNHCGPGGACSTGTHVLVDANGDKTTYATGLLGQSFVMKPQTAGDALGPSDFYAISVTGPNANDFRDDIGQCASVQVACQTTYNVKTGNMKGPTQQGVDNLVGSPPEDHYVAIGQYRHPDNNIYDTSRALVIAPIVDLCGYMGFCPSGQLPPGGNDWLAVKGFAQFFVEGVAETGPNQGNVTGRLVNVFGCDPNATPAENGSVTFGLPIRLVREP